MQVLYLIFLCFYLPFVSTSANDYIYKKNTFIIDNATGKNTAKLRPQRSILQGIFPGTKWCGPGDVASHTYDFGRFVDTDRCCRDHDLCESIIFPKETRFGIKNKGRITMLSCSCDFAFYKCLKSVNSRVSRTIGNTYFNLLHRKCFYFNFEDESYKWMRVPNFTNSSIIKFLATLTRNPFKKNLKLLMYTL